MGHSKQKIWPIEELIDRSKPLFSCSKEIREPIIEIARIRDEDLSLSKKIEAIEKVTSDENIVAAARFLSMFMRDHDKEELEKAIAANSN